MDIDWDLRIWVETPKEICLERGLAREHMPKERAFAAWKEVWQPEEDEYIKKTNPIGKANIVLDGIKPFATQVVK